MAVMWRLCILALNSGELPHATVNALQLGHKRPLTERIVLNRARGSAPRQVARGSIQ